MSSPIITSTQARRISIDAQGLAAARRETDVLGVARRLRCIQMDPINVVARTQLLVLFSRLGAFDPLELDRLLFEDKSLFHYWAHAASFVLAEDFPIHTHLMKNWPGEGKWADEVRAWMDEHTSFQRYILRELKKRPMRSKDFVHRSVRGWQSSGWTNNQSVSRMLDFMWVKGQIMIAGRQGLERVWTRTDLWFPPEVRAGRISERAAVERAAVHSLRALGIATRKQISQHFTRGRYPGLQQILTSLIRKGAVTEVVVKDRPGAWYMLTEALGLIDDTAKGWRGRTTLLSPFDNLICDRDRTNLLFGFDFRIEIYVPRSERKYGYYVLPIIDGDRLVGRIDPRMDRKTGTLTVNNLYVEPVAEGKLPAARRARSAIEALASWLGATDIAYGNIAESWRPAFKG